MSVFNGEIYVEQAVNSILEQSYKNYELIIINDGSTDRTSIILDQLSKLDNRIKVYHSENKGLIRQLNFAITVAKGIWIARMDADDVSEKYRLEKQLKYLIGEELDLCGSWYAVIDKKGATIDKIETPVTHIDITCALVRRCPFAHGSVMGRAEIFQKFSYCEDKFTSVEDLYLWQRMSMAGVRMGNVPEYLFKYRDHGASFSKSKIKKMTDEALILCQAKISYLKQAQDIMRGYTPISNSSRVDHIYYLLSTRSFNALLCKYSQHKLSILKAMLIFIKNNLKYVRHVK